MQIRFFSYLRKYGVLTVKYAFFLFNLSLLIGLGIRTVKLWITDPFDFSDTLNAYPDEPEWSDKVAAENQFWIALSLETLLFIIGGFLCYEILIKRKTFRRSLITPIAIAFLFAAGESISLFLPATEKVQQIMACKALNISWDVQNHKCHVMDLELRRFEELKARKKRKIPSVNAAVPKTPKQAVIKDEKEKRPVAKENEKSASIAAVKTEKSVTNKKEENKPSGTSSVKKAVTDIKKEQKK